MKVVLDRQPNSIEAYKVQIVLEDKTFTISIDKFGELIINKSYYGEESNSITIHPKVSNEIGIV